MQLTQVLRKGAAGVTACASLLLMTSTAASVGAQLAAFSAGIALLLLTGWLVRPYIKEDGR